MADIKRVRAKAEAFAPDVDGLRDREKTATPAAKQTTLKSFFGGKTEAKAEEVKTVAMPPAKKPQAAKIKARNEVWLHTGRQAVLTQSPQSADPQARAAQIYSHECASVCYLHACSHACTGQAVSEAQGAHQRLGRGGG